MDMKYLNELIEKANVAMGKKLSTKQRKKLKDSQFCGPGRSFPVNDCAHYTAALRLLNRSKYSDSTKKNIRACIVRRGKKLGCKGAKKDKAFLEAFEMTIEDTMALPIFKKTRAMVEESLENPGTDLDFTGCC
jgi:hypothetical protein